LQVEQEIEIMVTITIALIIVVAVVIVAWPFFNPAHDPDVLFLGAADPTLEGLVVQRDATYTAIKDLDFDREMGKLSDADYSSMRSKLETKAVAVLRELDALKGSGTRTRDIGSGDEVIEREVQRLRRSAPATGAKCPKCGTAHAAGDAFCAKCGTTLRGARCPNCGTRAAVGDKFCARCGAHVKA
jgi:hypothetical protein